MSRYDNIRVIEQPLPTLLGHRKGLFCYPKFGGQCPPN